MNRRKRTLRARFAPETRFEVAPNPAAPFRAAQDAELEQFKARLLRGALLVAEDIDECVLLRRAANEAAAVAWTTPFPLLFLPALFEEKQATVRFQMARQRKVRARSRELLDLVA
jgi:hypothetical protein